MAHSFKSNTGIKAFGVFSEPQNAGDYIYNKKARATYCVANNCVPSVKVGSESNLLLFYRSNRLSINLCRNSINRANLFINLLTKLDLSGNIPVIEDLSGNQVPSTINTDVIPYLEYNVDPSGNLFGNTICGINNFVDYMVYNKPYETENPGHINNL
jgi:hypothetical protein